MIRKHTWGLAALVIAAVVSASPAADADKYLPADTEQVAVINVKQILGSALVKKYALDDLQKQLKDNKEYKQLQEATGIDILTDVHSITIANSGTTGEKAMVIVRGKFDTDKIHKTAEAFAKEKKDELKIDKIGERPLYEGTKDGKSLFVLFIDGTTMVASPSKDFVKTAAEGKAGKINKDLATALEGVDAKQSIWVAGLIPDEARKQLDNLRQGQVELLKKVKAGSGGLMITDTVTATVTMSTGDADAAKKLEEAGKGLKGVLAFFAMSNEQIKPFADELLKTLDIKSSKGDVSVSFKLSEDFIKKAVEMIPRP